MHLKSCLGALYQIVVHKPYCVSRLIQIFPQCYRFHVYCKRLKINTFQNGRCTHPYAAIVFLVGIAAFSIFGSVKNNGSPFFREAIVIFCTQGIITIFYTSLIFPFVKSMPNILFLHTYFLNLQQF